MIELLIVIAVLGFLAVAVLSAINPIEQINRSKDTASRSDAEQLISGTDRYYTQKGYYPWMTSVDDATGMQAMNEDALHRIDDDWTTNAPIALSLNSLTTGTQELKDSFRSRITLNDYNHLYLFNRGLGGDSTYVCFVGKSKAFLDDAWKRCTDASGTGLPADLKPVGTTICGSSTTAYACLP